MPEWLITFIVALVTATLAGGGFAQFMITRHDSKNDDLSEIKKRQDRAELDSVRLQLMFLIKLFPESVHEIMKCAEHYFRDLKGDWYMTSIFNSWLTTNEVAKPEWFDEND